MAEYHPRVLSQIQLLKKDQLLQRKWIGKAFEMLSNKIPYNPDMLKVKLIEIQK